MAPFTTSVAKFITTPHRILTRGGATWSYSPPSTDNPAYLADIPPAMQAKLRREGVVLAMLGGLFFFVLQCVSQVYFRDRAGDGEINALELAFSAIVALIFALYLYSFRAIRRFPLHREVRYRYKHGKWRWER